MKRGKRLIGAAVIAAALLSVALLAVRVGPWKIPRDVVKVPAGQAAARLAGLRQGWTVKEYGKQTFFERFRGLVEGGGSFAGILELLPARLPVGSGRLVTVDLVKFK